MKKYWHDNPVIKVQNRMANTLHEVEQKSSIYCYMTDLKTCTGDSSEEFNFWFLSIKSSKTPQISGLPKLKETF